MDIKTKPEHKLVPFFDIETERLLLRRFTQNDAQEMFDTWCADPDVTRYMMWTPHPDINETHTVIERWEKRYETAASELGERNYAIVVKQTNKLIGSIGIMPKERNAGVELGYCIGKSYWGYGYVTEAAQALTAFAFESMDAQKVVAFHHTDNPASGRIMQKCGMTYEGVLRREFFAPAHGMCDAVCYSILREEYFSRKGG